MASVAIVLLNYNSTRLTRQCTRSLHATKREEDTYHVVVWDNDSIVKPKQEELGDCDLQLSSTNDGFAGGYNRAVAYALKKYRPQFLVVLNNDTVVPKGLISELLATCNTYKNNCIVVPKIYFAKGREFHKKSYSIEEKGHVLWYAGGMVDWRNVLPFHKGVDEVDRGHFDKKENTEFVTGCCFCTTPAIWKKLRGFDEKYFLYYEDLDFSIRASKKKIPLVYTPMASVFHINAGSSSGSGSAIHQYYQTRNRLRFGLKYAKWRTKIALLKEVWRRWRSGDPFERLGILHALEGKWGNQNKMLTIKK